MRTRRRILLQNEQATLDAILTAIYEKMVQNTRPGDTAFLFFSCHGGRCADTNGDEADGLDEYLVPDDAELGKPETMLLDDMFARWMAALDGRQVFIVLDNCYSGGSSKGVAREWLKDVKGLDDGIAVQARVHPPWTSSTASWRREGPGAEGHGRAGGQPGRPDRMGDDRWQRERPDVLRGATAGIPETDADHDGRVSVKELYETIKQPVARYVQDTFHGAAGPDPDRE